MDRIVDVRFERVEKALATLVESITKYNPQASQAVELANADSELGHGLKQLETHQNNYRRLESLKASSSALDAQIRDTIRTLWTTRKDITSTSTTAAPDGPQYDVNYEELLSYARRISKMTLPPASILSRIDAANPESAASTGEAVNTPNTTAAPTPAAGGSTPNPNAASNGAPTPAAQPQSQGQQGTQTTANSGATALPEEWTQFLDPLTGHVFLPWATEDKIRVGALASIQNLVEEGIDPRGYDPAEEEVRRQKEEQERREQEEREALEREENLKKMREEQARIARERQRERERLQDEALRRGSTGGEGPSPSGAAASNEPQKKQFQFMGGDLDDDDDD
ncbi:putative mediator of rna polymerase ii transcription subunit 4 [Diaporthe ampelina]|uniref:Mediator of RNA polymerase II transcription subunit 4 n=1 Tax=Diaporthe ampelina TaxID=1214573 RepID=A0A0G2FUV5_9PEZI|nr:putative mediator of rna polymerase ii transcription subunit 4 [Diaporthe ampelina]